MEQLYKVKAEPRFAQASQFFCEYVHLIHRVPTDSQCCTAVGFCCTVLKGW